MTLQSHDISHDVRSQAQSRLEQFRQIMSRSMLAILLPHSIHMVYSQMTHGLQGRVIIKQHGPCVIYINRVALQQRLLVEFSCDPYIDSLLKALLVCVIIGLCVQWLPQHRRQHVSLADEATEDIFALFWKVIILLVKKALSCFQEQDSRAFFSAYLIQQYLQSYFQQQ